MLDSMILHQSSEVVNLLLVLSVYLDLVQERRVGGADLDPVRLEMEPGVYVDVRSLQSGAGLLQHSSTHAPLIPDGLLLGDEDRAGDEVNDGILMQDARSHYVITVNFILQHSNSRARAFPSIITLKLSIALDP